MNRLVKLLLLGFIASILFVESTLADTTSIHGQSIEIHAGASIATGLHVGSRLRLFDVLVLETSYSILPIAFPGRRISFGISLLTSESGTSVISVEFVSRQLEPNYPRFFLDNYLVVSVGWLPLRQSGVSPFFRGGIAKAIGQDGFFFVEANVGIMFVFE